MSEPDELNLSSDARAILDAARPGEEPSSADVERLRGRVFAHLGIGLAASATAALAAGSTAEAAVATGAGAQVVASTAATVAVGSGATTLASGSGAVSTTSAGWLVGWLGSATTSAKLAVAIVVAGVSTAGVVAVSRDAEAPPGSTWREDVTARAAGASAASRRRASDRSTSPQGAQAAPAQAPADVPAPSVASPAPSAANVKPSTVAPAAPSPHTSAPPPSELDHLAEETALVARAQTALGAGRYEEALATASEHQQRFPKGVLAQERNAVRWLALCGSGRAAQARDAVAAFLAAQPSSPMAARLRSACAIAP